MPSFCRVSVSSDSVLSYPATFSPLNLKYLAMALVRKDAAILVKDSEAQEKLLPAAIELLADSERVRSMQENIAKLAKTDAAMTIAEEAYKLIGK